MSILEWCQDSCNLVHKLPLFNYASDSISVSLFPNL